MLTDRGLQFSAAFDRTCGDLGIEHRRTKAQHPWTNGFVERLQGTILSQLGGCALRRTYYTALDQLERHLQAYLPFYNRERPHQLSLEGKNTRVAVPSRN